MIPILYHGIANGPALHCQARRLCNASGPRGCGKEAGSPRPRNWPARPQIPSPDARKVDQKGSPLNRMAASETTVSAVPSYSDPK